MKYKLRVLIVEDEIIIAWDLKRILERMEQEVVSIAPSADTAVEQTRTGSPDLVIMDIMLKGARTGIDAAMEIRAFSRVPIVFLTGNSHLMDDPRIHDAQAQGMYGKPPTEEQLKEILEIARKTA